jgi:hypothetical protein
MDASSSAIASTRKIYLQWKQLVKEDLQFSDDEKVEVQKQHRQHLLQFIRETLSELTTLTSSEPEICEYLASSTTVVEEIKNILGTHEDVEVVVELLKFVGDFLEEIDSIPDEAREKGLTLVNKLIDSQFPYIISDMIMPKYSSSKEVIMETLRILLDFSEIYPTAFPLHVIENTKLVENLLKLLTNSITESKKRKKKQPTQIENGDLTVNLIDVEEPLQASELLSIILHATEKARLLFVTDEQKMTDLLTCIAYWKSSDPEFPEEQEWFENLNSCLQTVLLDQPEAKQIFRSLDGVELALKIIKNGGEIGEISAMKLLQIATAHDLENCRKVVDAGGLKIIFPCFVSASRDAKRVKLTDEDDKDSSKRDKVIAALGVIYNLVLMLLPEDIEYARLKAKFLEQGKFEQLISLHEQSANAVNKHITELEENLDDSDENSSVNSDEEYMELLDNGLDLLQKVDVILARLLGDADLGSNTKEALDKISLSITEDIQRVVADFAERVVVLKGDAIDDEMTSKIKTTLIDFALFESS